MAKDKGCDVIGFLLWTSLCCPCVWGGGGGRRVEGVGMEEGPGAGRTEPQILNSHVILSKVKRTSQRSGVYFHRF